MYPFLRDPEKVTIKDLRSRLRTTGETIVCQTSDLQVRLSNEDRMVVQVPVGKKKVDVPLYGGGGGGFTALADWLQVPPKFLERQPRDLQALILNEVAKREPGEMAVTFQQEAIERISDPHKETVKPLDIVEAIGRVMPPSSQVIDWYDTPRMFQADICVPATSKHGVGGDRKVNDITRAGLRVGVDIQHGRAPYLQSWLYRLMCTNGMEVPDAMTKVEVNAKTVPEIIDQMESLCQVLWGRMDHLIEEFYSLRDVPMKNHDEARTLVHRIVTENGLPLRGARFNAVVEAVEAIEATPTMFDVVNLITHEANNPDLTNNPTQRRRLEVGGGRVMHDHAERCSRCHSRLTK